MNARLMRLRERMGEKGLPAVLVMQRENIFFLSGFTSADGALIVTEDQHILVSDFRYLLQAAEEAPDWTFVLAERGLTAKIREVLEDLGVRRVGFGPEHVTVAQLRELSGDTTAPYVLEPNAGIVTGLRLVKEPGELAIIRQAAQITDAAYAHLLTFVQPGVAERDLALEAEWYMRRQGAQGASFEMIVAAGAHSALPHAVTGSRLLQPGDMVIVDMGARYAHYCADMTRTFAVGHATPEAQRIYRICLDAQLAGVEHIHAGMTGREADAVVRTVIEDAGFGEFFGHGTGHGVGLAVHEAPRLSRYAEGGLPAGTVVTVEPGIYLPDFGGVRIEDLVEVTDTGVEIYTATAKPTELPVVG